MGMTQRDVVGREVGGGSCLGMHVRIKDLKKNKKIKASKKKKKRSMGNPQAKDDIIETLACRATCLELERTLFASYLKPSER